MIDYIQPLYFFFLLLVFVGLIQVCRHTNLRKPLLLAIAVVCLFLISWPPFVWVLLQPFERPFAPAIIGQNDAQAIVVLAGGIQYSSVPGPPASNLSTDTLERCQYAAYLHNHWRPLFILASGGGNQPEPNATPYSTFMKTIIEKEGVPASLIWTEVKSHSTHENAEFSAQILRQKGITKIILVTDAYHMWRAMKSFRKEGLVVVPAACGYRSIDKINLGNLMPGWESIHFSEDLLHEVLGLIWYKIHGWI